MRRRRGHDENVYIRVIAEGPLHLEIWQFAWDVKLSMNRYYCQKLCNVLGAQIISEQTIAIFGHVNVFEVLKVFWLDFPNAAAFTK